MEGKYYTAEKSQQIVIALLKAHHIKKVIASPGTTNYTLVASMQQDSFFEIYSSIDERSAAYMACGLAAESGEPVVITCTGATASRNYMPGLTEAYYRKLPVLAITASQGDAKIGHHIAQVIDRREQPNDIVNLSVSIPICKDAADEWNAQMKANEAILALYSNGGGPAHINLDTGYSRDFSVKKLPHVRVIERLGLDDVFPILPEGDIGIFVGSHKPFSPEETETIDRFCELTNAVVFCDHTSSYQGKFRVDYSIVCSQDRYSSPLQRLRLLIHIGEISGEYYSLGRLIPDEEWRVSPDGKLRDRFKKLTKIFMISEKNFFQTYSNMNEKRPYVVSRWKKYDEECKSFLNHLPELPFSNIWMASKMAGLMPTESYAHFGILGSLRAWNFFPMDKSVRTYSNVGGFGIDGGMSTLIGASLAHPDNLHFGIFGDLAFFYDLNSLGNRHIKNNLRIMLVNNGKGAEFRLYWHPASEFGDEADDYMAAGGHFGNKSPRLVKDYAEALGFEYISASNKEQFEQTYRQFVSPTIYQKPILFEVFTKSEDENEALYLVRNMRESSDYKKIKIKNAIKGVIGEHTAHNLKKLIK